MGGWGTVEGGIEEDKWEKHEGDDREDWVGNGLEFIDK